MNRLRVPMTVPYEFYLQYGEKRLKVKAEWMYESDQIQRIKVSIGDHYMILQNDFPLWKATNSKKRIDWKIKEGMFKDAGFFQQMKAQLEDKIKNPVPIEKIKKKSW